jgi:hypothetical protein
MLYHERSRTMPTLFALKDMCVAISTNFCPPALSVCHYLYGLATSSPRARRETLKSLRGKLSIYPVYLTDSWCRCVMRSDAGCISITSRPGPPAWRTCVRQRGSLALDGESSIRYIPFGIAKKHDGLSYQDRSQILRDPQRGLAASMNERYSPQEAAFPEEMQERSFALAIRARVWWPLS